MNQNEPKILPLQLILYGTTILAIPGAFGAIYLFIFVLALLSDLKRTVNSADFYSLFYPIPVIIGFFLFSGYIWTKVKNRYIKWFWLFSAGYNLLATLVSGFYILKMIYDTVKFDNLSDNLLRLFFLLFPIWTLFVTMASVKIAFFKPTDNIK